MKLQILNYCVLYYYCYLKVLHEAIEIFINLFDLSITK